MDREAVRLTLLAEALELFLDRSDFLLQYVAQAVDLIAGHHTGQVQVAVQRLQGGPLFLPLPAQAADFTQKGLSFLSSGLAPGYYRRGDALLQSGVGGAEPARLPSQQARAAAQHEQSHEQRPECLPPDRTVL